MIEVTKLRSVLADVEDPRALLEALVANAPMAFLIYDERGRCILANEACATLFGSVPPPGYNIFEDENLAAAGVASIVRRAFEGETIHIPPIWYDPRALKHVAAEGQRVGNEVTAFPIRDRQGVVRHVAFAIRDATAELQLKQASEKLDRFQSSGIMGTFEFEIGGERTITHANDRFLEMLGYTRDDLASEGISAEAMTPSEYREADLSALAEIEATGKVAPREKDFFRKDGTRLPIIIAGALLQSDRRRGVAFILDNARQKKVEHDLLKREAWFRALVANSSDAICLFDRTGTITFASESLTRVLGWKPQAVVGTSDVRSFFHPDDLEAVDAEVEKCLAQPGVPLRAEARVRHSDGNYRIAEIVRMNLYKDPVVRAMVVNVRDVTESRALQQQFLHAQKMEAIGQLAGGIAHDFNNMLSAILGFAGIIASELPPADPLAADVKEIITAAERASLLTRQLLAFSRKQILELKVIDLSVQLRELERMLKRLLGEDVELVMSLPPNLGLVKVDPAQIEQVVLNLVINARDALGENGRITIETANVVLDEEYARIHLDVSPGPYVLIGVSDNGTGMEKNVRERIFEPFFTTKGVGRGTGLGLATVFGIVKQSGGHIWLYSEPGRGTTFKVYLPRTDSETPSVTTRGPRSAPARGTETILLVEDEPGVRTFAKRALQRVGYVVLDASNGGEALLMVEQHQGPIDLMLTDVVMPRMSGRVLAERLAQLRPSLKVLFMSGYTENAIVHHGVLDDGTDFIPKPIALEALLTKVREVLDRQVPSGDSGGATRQGQQ